jgi:hypothetical protein
MTEWLLIVYLLQGTPITVDGFQSQLACENAGQEIAQRLLIQAHKQSSNAQHSLSANFECLRLTK